MDKYQNCNEVIKELTFLLRQRKEEQESRPRSVFKMMSMAKPIESMNDEDFFEDHTDLSEEDENIYFDNIERNKDIQSWI